MSWDILKILVVEPNPETSNYIKSVFNNAHIAPTVREAAILIKQLEPDCVVCDYNIQDSFLNIKDGVDFLSSLKTNTKEFVKILMSSDADFDKLKSAINDAGIFRFVSKPFSEDEFRNSVNSALEYVALIRENSGLIAKAESRNQYLLKLKTILEDKSKEQTENMRLSDQIVKRVKTQFEIINGLLTNMQNVASIEQMEKIIRKELYDSIDVDYVKIILNEENIADDSPNMVSTHLFCSGSHLGYIKFGRGTKSGITTVFNSGELELFDKVADIVAMSTEKIIKFSVLQKLKKQWELVFDSIGDPLIVIDKNFEVIRANRSFEKLTDVKVQNIIGRKCYTALCGTQKDSPCNGCNVLQTFQTGLPVGSQVNFNDKKKSYTTWTYPIIEGRTINNVVQFYKDVSEQLIYKEKILYSEKLAELGILAGSVAHEINNPIGGILAFLQMMLSETDKNSSIYEDLSEMERAAKRCKQIADNLLHFSRQSKDEEIKNIEISLVFETLLPLIYLQIRHENIEVKLNDNSNGALVSGVFNELVQAFFNIVNMSIELIQKRGDNGAVSIDVYQEDSKVFVSVWDNGEKFIDDGEFQNLALFVTKKIVKGYNGEITFTANEDGDGNYYKISFPLVTI